jgi:hypothetical protein
VKTDKLTASKPTSNDKPTSDDNQTRQQTSKPDELAELTVTKPTEQTTNQANQHDMADGDDER